MLPLDNPALKSARLVKNVELRGVLELFLDKDAGSGQIAIASIPQAFGWTDLSQFTDRPMLDQVGQLLSYDVYSLRIGLRELGISVADQEHLQLSEGKIAELAEYMKAFTAPLMKTVFGTPEVEAGGYYELVGLFRDAEPEQACENLQKLADNLKIRLDGVPQFLEDYGDVYLSLSYYKQCLANNSHVIAEFIDALAEIRGTNALNTDKNLMATCDELERNIVGMTEGLTARIEQFEQYTNDMWENVSEQTFREIEALITRYHLAIGGTLCTLTIKMNAWKEWFPDRSGGSPRRRAEFIRREFGLGFEALRSRIREKLPTDSKYGA